MLDGCGGVSKIDVVSTDKPNITGKFTFTSTFKNDLTEDSILTAYTFAKNFLKKKGNVFLENHSLHISVDMKHKFKFCGSSGVCFVHFK